jgi:transposase
MSIIMESMGRKRSRPRRAFTPESKGDGLTSDERVELARLRQDNRRLREDVDILKRATAFLGKETR